MMIFCHVTMEKHNGTGRLTLFRNFTRRELVDYFVNPYLGSHAIVSEGRIWSASEIRAPQIYESEGKITNPQAMEIIGTEVTDKFLPASAPVHPGLLHGLMDWVLGARHAA